MGVNQHPPPPRSDSNVSEVQYSYHLPKEIIDAITDNCDDWETYLCLRVGLRTVDEEPNRAIRIKFSHPRCSKEALASLHACYQSNKLFRDVFAAFRIPFKAPDPFGRSPEFVVLRSFYNTLVELGRRCCPNSLFPLVSFAGETCHPVSNLGLASGDAAQSCEVDPLSITSQRRALLASFQSDLPRDKCRNVSFFLSNFTLGDNGYLNRICSLLLFDEREVTSLYRRLSRRLATYNGYKENGWSSLPSQPAAFDDYVSWKVLPVVLRILDVCDKDDAEVYRGEFRRHWKMEGENLMDLMDAFEKLSVSFLGWPQRYSCLYCSSVALEALGMASGDLL